MNRTVQVGIAALVVAAAAGGYWYVGHLQASSAQAVPQTAQENTSSRPVIAIDAASLRTHSSHPTITGTANGPQSITLEIRTAGALPESLGSITGIPVNGGHWAISLGGSSDSPWGHGYIEDLDPGTYSACVTAVSSTEYCKQLVILK